MLREDPDARSPLKFEKYLNPALDLILWLRPEKCRSKREIDTSGSQFLKNSYSTTQTYRLLSESRIEKRKLQLCNAFSDLDILNSISFLKTYYCSIYTAIYSS